MDITEFLKKSYTAYHTVENVCSLLLENDFEQLFLDKKWRLQQGKGYFVTQNDSSVVAFKVGKSSVYNVCESHTDSPAFKVKGNSVLVDKMLCRLNTEKYGGGLLYSFFDRPLKVAGRIITETEKGVVSENVVSKFNLVIPSLAIHHNPTANESFSVNPQIDTLPLFSGKEQDVYKTLTSKKVLDADLYVVPSQEPFVAGVNGEFLCSARLDNLTSVYSCVSAIVNCAPSGIAVAACLDNEEVGSGTRQGSPTFLDTVIRSLENALEMNFEQKRYARENGLIVSVDNGHATHPAHPEKCDPKQVVSLNGGVVIKHNPNYATDGLSSAIVKKVLSDNGVKYQDYYNRSDIRCGSTLGLASARTLQMKCCDIGLAQLAMHSACETIGKEDLSRMEKALTAFLQCKLSNTEKGVNIK